MAKGRKFYWIKLKTSFLTSEKVDYLLSQKNGSDYVVIYQMLCLKTINTGGELAAHIGEVLVPYDVEKIQRDLKHFNIDTIRVALELYKNLGMVYTQEDGVIRISDFNELIGCETDWAERKRIQRDGQCPSNVHPNVHEESRVKSLEYRDRDIDIRDRLRIIFDRFKEAGYDEKKLEEIETRMTKVIKNTDIFPNIEKIEDIVIYVLDTDVRNIDAYITKCIENERIN